MSHRLTDLDDHVFTIKDLKEKGSAKLTDSIRDYINEGSMDLLTLQDNEDAYNRYKLRPRNLRDVSVMDISTNIFDTKVQFPFGFSPASSHQLAHPDGEVATSRAAAKNNIPMAISDHSSRSIEDVTAQGKGNPYMQHICFYTDRSLNIRVIQRAEAAGCKALFVSVDIPVLGLRLNEYRNKFDLPPGLTCPMIAEEDGSLPKHLAFDSKISWEDGMKWLRQQTKMQIWLKGITSAEDVELAIQHGADGVIISNHGGRQLDGVPASLDALRECAPIAKERIKIAVDGGIRRGSDIFKALALGAEFCFGGRIPFWGLAYNGEDGVDLAIKILLREFETTMALCGCKSVSEISRAHLSILKPDGLLCRL